MVLVHLRKLPILRSKSSERRAQDGARFTWRMMLMLSVPAMALALTGSPDVKIAPGVMMPLVAAGTWQYNDSTAENAVAAAIGAGFTHIDTAADYKNQRGVSKGLARSGVGREAIFVTTKVPGCGFQGVRPGHCEEDTLAAIRADIAQLSGSFMALKQLDLVLLHFPPCTSAPAGLPSPVASSCNKDRTGCSGDNLAAVRAQWHALEAAKAANLTRAIGVSNFCAACLDAVIAGGKTPPAVNQVQFHVGMGANPQHFLSAAKSRGVVLQAWSPLGHGGHGSSDIMHGPLTTGIGAAHNKSAVQVALKWIVSKGVAVVTKSGNPVHLREDLDLFDFSFTPSEVADLDAATFARQDTPSFMCDDAVETVA